MANDEDLDARLQDAVNSKDMELDMDKDDDATMLKEEIPK